MAPGDDQMSDIITTTLEYNSYVNFVEEEVMRSPRSPTWAPSLQVTPFDFEKYFPRSPLPPQLKKSALPPQPESPLPWIWQCHLCRNRYPLGVTRRCLYDGHYYCSGESNVKNVKKKKKGQACSSEFDYEGWDEYGEWKRQALAVIDQAKVLGRCEKCDFPSMCRTPHEQFPIKKDPASPKPPTVLPLAQGKTSGIELDFQLPSAEELVALEAGEKEDHLRHSGHSAAKADRNIDFETILNQAMKQGESEKKQKQFMVTDLLKKSKSRKGKSPMDRGNESMVTLGQERSDKGSGQDFVMPSLDLWVKTSKK